MTSSHKKCENDLNHKGGKLNLSGLSFKCCLCSHKFKRSNRLEQHEKKHIPPGGFICTICNARFCYEIDRAKHREIHTSLRKCLICELKFPSNELYLEHINDLHGGKTGEILECQQCCVTFRTSLLFKQHIETKCGKIKKFQCYVCKSKFINQNTLNAHKMIHAEKKQHLCDYCGNSFLSNGQLKVHKRRHTGEKPFKCEHCDKSFAYRESLVTHSSIHTGIKPYICEVCNKQFSCIGNLIKHRRTRPETCGQPQYVNKITKIAPRASAKNRRNLVASLLLQTNKEKSQLLLSKSKSVPSVPLSPSLLPISSKPLLLNQEDVNLIENSNNIVTNIDNDLVESIIDIQIKCLRSENVYDVDDDGDGDDDDEDDESQIQNQNDMIAVKDENQESYEDYSQTHNKETVLRQNGNDLSDLKIDVVFNEKIQSSDKTSILVDNSTIKTSETIIRPIRLSQEIKIEYLPPLPPKISEISPTSIHQVQTIYKIDEKFIPIIRLKKLETHKNHPQEQLTENILIKTLFVCPKCGKKFTTKLAIIDHENSNCGKTPQYQCTTCHKLYHSAGSLKNHLTIHTGELPFKCQYCDKQFRTNGQVKIHERKHNGDKPFNCEYCNKSFAYRESILTHLSLHTGIKRFICNSCGNRFSCRSNLRAHRKSHKQTCGGGDGGGTGTISGGRGQKLSSKINQKIK